MTITGVSDPKQRVGLPPSWYRYYAGYSPQFVADTLDALSIRSGALLDPWMGAGTTLAVGAERRLRVTGVDLNPAMVVITKARMIATDTTTSLDPLARELVQSLGEPTRDERDPLTQWFSTDSAMKVRALCNRIDEALVEPGQDSLERVDSMSSLAAFYHVAVFASVKDALRTFQSKNPTWTKRAKVGAGILEWSRDEIAQTFLRQVGTMAKLAAANAIDVRAHDESTILRGDSRALPLKAKSQDVTITSPPYCTRLDYVVGHLPEIACLGLSASSVQELRHAMIGTPTMQHASRHAVIGAVAQEFIATVESHPAYASKNYYAPNFRQYFEGMGESLSSIDRVMKPGGSVVLVVQDSRYKDVHLDLAGAMEDVGRAVGWSLVGRKDFVAARSIASMNSKTSDETRRAKPVESVLHFSVS